MQVSGFTSESIFKLNIIGILNFIFNIQIKHRMRRNIAITLMISAYAMTVQSAASWEKSGPAYEKMSAQAKESALWKDISADQNSYGWYSALSLGGLFTESMLPSM